MPDAPETIDVTFVNDDTHPTLAATPITVNGRAHPFKWNERISMAVEAVEVAVAAGFTVILHEAEELLGLDASMDAEPPAGSPVIYGDGPHQLSSPPALAVDGEGAPPIEGVVGALDGASEPSAAVDPADSQPAADASTAPADGTQAEPHTATQID